MQERRPNYSEGNLYTLTRGKYDRATKLPLLHKPSQEELSQMVASLGEFDSVELRDLPESYRPFDSSTEKEYEQISLSVTSGSHQIAFHVESWDIEPYTGIPGQRAYTLNHYYTGKLNAELVERLELCSQISSTLQANMQGLFGSLNLGFRRH